MPDKTTTTTTTDRATKRSTGMSRRRKPGERWARSFSMVHFGPGGAKRSLDSDLSDLGLAAELEDARGRVQFRFRFDGKSRDPSVRLDDGPEAVIERRALLLAGIDGDWDLGPDRWPVPPGTATVHILGRPGRVTEEPDSGSDGDVVDLFADRPQPAAPEPTEPEETKLAGTGTLGIARVRYDGIGEPPSPLMTFDDLVDWRGVELARTTAKDKSTKRKPGTLGGADNQLRFAAAYFRSVPDGNGASPVSASLSGPDAITQEHCEDFVTYRQHTNLDIRTQNETAVAAWAREAERSAASGGNVPPPPVLAVEVASVRTIKASADAVRAALTDAFVEGLIETQPWTARVDKRVESPPRTHHSQKQLPNEDEWRLIPVELKALERRSIVGGRAMTVTGERYVMFVELTERFHLRPEEARAIRRSSVRHSDKLGRHLVISESIVFVSSRFTNNGSSMQVQELKARLEGDVRTFFVDDDFFDRVDAHIAKFVPEADPTSDRRDVADPLLFTTHNGAVIAPGPFNKNWWGPAVATASKTAPVLKGFEFRQLRHTGITRRIEAGDHIDDIAEDAGNTSDVIRNHYRGVIEAVERSGRRPNRRRTGGDGLAALAANDLSVEETNQLFTVFDDAQLHSLYLRIKAERGMRADD